MRGDQKVHVTQLHPVMSEMGSVLGDSSIAEDIEGDSVCDESSGSWKTMLRVREKILTLYHNHSMCDEVIKRYGSIPSPSCSTPTRRWWKTGGYTAKPPCLATKCGPPRPWSTPR